MNLKRMAASHRGLDTGIWATTDEVAVNGE